MLEMRKAYRTLVDTIDAYGYVPYEVYRQFGQWHIAQDWFGDSVAAYDSYRLALYIANDLNRDLLKRIRLTNEYHTHACPA